MNPVLTITHTLDIPQEPDLVQIQLNYINGQTIRARLSGNGKVHNLVIPMSKSLSAVNYFLITEPEKIASAFDTVGTLANTIDGEWLVEHLLKKVETMENVEDKEALSGRVKRLAMVSSLMVLHAIGNDVMTELFGHNWVAELSSKLIRRSKEWAALVERVRVAQEGLKIALPT